MKQLRLVADPEGNIMAVFCVQRLSYKIGVMMMIDEYDEPVVCQL